jgi:hypothetical protein
MRSSVIQLRQIAHVHDGVLLALAVMVVAPHAIPG